MDRRNFLKVIRENPGLFLSSHVKPHIPSNLWILFGFSYCSEDDYEIICQALGIIFDMHSRQKLFEACIYLTVITARELERPLAFLYFAV